MEEERKKGKKRKENSTELQMPKVEAEIHSNHKKCDGIYTCAYTPISQIKRPQQK